MVELSLPILIRIRSHQVFMHYYLNNRIKRLCLIQHLHVMAQFSKFAIKLKLVRNYVSWAASTLQATGQSSNAILHGLMTIIGHPSSLSSSPKKKIYSNTSMWYFMKMTKDFLILRKGLIELLILRFCRRPKLQKMIK